VSTGLSGLLNSGISSGSINLIGFGAGANLFALASNSLQEKNHFIFRLTALSPTNLGFVSGLMPISAQFVDVIHTNIGLLFSFA
jgi:Lipase